MKFNLLTVALTTLSVAPSYALPSPYPLQLKVSIDLSEAIVESPAVLLVFRGTHSELLGNWYPMGSKFKNW